MRQITGTIAIQPQIVAVAECSGVRGGLRHKLDGVDPDVVSIGMAVEPVWADERTGALTDIAHPPSGGTD